MQENHHINLSCPALVRMQNPPFAPRPLLRPNSPVVQLQHMWLLAAGMQVLQSSPEESSRACRRAEQLSAQRSA